MKLSDRSSTKGERDVALRRLHQLLETALLDAWLSQDSSWHPIPIRETRSDIAERILTICAATPLQFSEHAFVRSQQRSCSAT